MKKKRSAKKTAVVRLSVGETVTTSSNPQAGEIIWYPAAKKSFIQTTVDYLKRWFK